MNILIFTAILNQKQTVLFPELHIITSQIVVLVDTDLHCTFKYTKEKHVSIKDAYCSAGTETNSNNRA
jgi:hypothetical protein